MVVCILFQVHTAFRYSGLKRLLFGQVF